MNIPVGMYIGISCMITIFPTNWIAIFKRKHINACEHTAIVYFFMSKTRKFKCPKYLLPGHLFHHNFADKNFGIW